MRNFTRRDAFRLFCALLGYEGHALQTYPLIDQHEITVSISSDQPNRIAVFGDRIGQIFGAEGAFDVQSDDERGQIFVRLLNPQQSKTLTLTIVTESGLTQDLTLLPKAIGFQSVLLKPASVSETHLSRGLSRMRNLVRLMQSMALGKRAEGYTFSGLNQSDPKKDRTYPEPLKTTPRLIYREEEGNWEGRVYLLRNEGEEILKLTPEILAFPKDIALSLSKTSLLPGEEGLLFVISSVGGQP